MELFLPVAQARSCPCPEREPPPSGRFRSTRERLLSVGAGRAEPCFLGMGLASHGSPRMAPAGASAGGLQRAGVGSVPESARHVLREADSGGRELPLPGGVPDSADHGGWRSYQGPAEGRGVCDKPCGRPGLQALKGRENYSADGTREAYARESAFQLNLGGGGGELEDSHVTVERDFRDPVPVSQNTHRHRPFT